jgi:nucleotide-binding universal stress UspA family protein
MFHHMLVPLDGSSLAEGVLPHAVAVARAYDARITLLHVAECPARDRDSPPIDPLAWQMRKTSTQAYLNELSQCLEKTRLSIDTVLLEGQPAPRIIEYAHTNNVDLIALSSHGEGGLSGWNIGSIVHKLVQRAHVSALIVRAYCSPAANLTDLHYQRILVPLDGSPRADYAVGPAVRLAEYHHAQLILTHVVTKPHLFPHMPPRPEFADMVERLQEYNSREAAHYLEQMKTRLNGNVTTRIAIGDDVAVRLHQLVQEEAVDLIVVSAHGKSGKTLWPLGSVSANLILYGASSILVMQDLLAEQIEPTYAERFAQERAGH